MRHRGSRLFLPSVAITSAVIGACGCSGSTAAGAAAGGNGGAGVISTGTGGAAQEGGTIDPDAACSVTTESTTAVSTDIFVMQDRSGSMDCPAADDGCQNPTQLSPPTRWDAFGEAVDSFVHAPSSVGIGVGIGFFGLRVGTSDTVSCTASDYSKPAVAIAPLPANAPAISNAIAKTRPFGSTPTVPALTGAIAYTRAYATSGAGRDAAVVLVTDGAPTDCKGNTVDAAAMIAEQAYKATPSIKTYVVGLGDTAALDQIALAGSGGKTHYFRASGDVAKQLGMALTTIVGMITCRYDIPTQAGRAIDPTLVNVQTTRGGMHATIGKVSDASACGALGGWYYDDSARPRQVILCQQSCDLLRAAPESTVEILYGCPSVPPS
jgi:hypothetical protein